MSSAGPPFPFWLAQVAEPQKRSSFYLDWRNLSGFIQQYTGSVMGFPFFTGYKIQNVVQSAAIDLTQTGVTTTIVNEQINGVLFAVRITVTSAFGGGQTAVGRLLLNIDGTGSQTIYIFNGTSTFTDAQLLASSQSGTGANQGDFIIMQLGFLYTKSLTIQYVADAIAGAGSPKVTVSVLRAWAL